ncbi:MAG TPA: hypothetical protein VEF76_12445 [Patescibacteria group bacterium]|nr:hypothetical protein [Patescibacteria group bacterium]
MIFPRRRFTLLSPLPPAAAEAALVAKLTPARSWRDRFLKRGGGGFQGAVAQGRFAIWRDISYQNAFLPRVAGDITPESGAGSRVTVVMSLQRRVKIFLTVWLAGIATLVVPLSCAALDGTLVPQEHSWAGGFIPLGLLALGLSFPHLGFWHEARKAENFLKDVLQAEKEQPPDKSRAV